MNFGENMESNVDFHIQNEAERLLIEIEHMMKNVENSKLYAEMRSDIEKNETFRKHLSRLLGSHSHVDVVIYALGSMEYNFHSQFQFAVILLLKRDFSNWIGNIQVYDPDNSPADIIIFKKLGLEVLTIDEDCKRQVRGPTMFYMPNPNFVHIGYLLGANWSSSCMNQILLLTNSYRQSLPKIYPDEFNREAIQRIERILPFTTEIGIKTSYEHNYINVFFDFSWHFFDMDPNIDMETSLSVTEFAAERPFDRVECSWLDEQRSLEEDFLETLQTSKTSHEFAEYFCEYRGPRRLRCNELPPPPGWVKLNIYGIGRKGNQPGRYCGVFQDETEKVLNIYSGTVDVEDDVIAGLEALSYGLIECMEGYPKVEKLIVESDNVMLIQYVNGRPEPNEVIMSRLMGIFDLLARIPCAIYHVYEEANELARDWALVST